MMHTWTILECRADAALRTLALCGALFVAGCASSSGVGVGSSQVEQPHDFANSILVIREDQYGGVGHVWMRESEFDWSARVDSVESISRNYGSVEFASHRRDCEQEQIDCFRRCWRRKSPYPHDRDKASRYKYCQEKCLEQYMECLRATGQRPLEFSKMDEALDWLKRHRRELLVGGVIVAAGVVFVVVSAGAGVLVLAPITVL